MPNNFAIIDGNSLLHRGYHAIPHLTNSKGQPTGAIFGFVTIFLKVLRELSPNYVAVTFDSCQPTFRHKKFPQYKAQRPAMEKLLVQQIPEVKRLVKSFNCPIFEIEGFEADDLIGTLAKKIRIKAPNLTIYIITGDMDTLQLVDEKTKIYTSKRGLTDTIIYDPKSVFARYGFEQDKMLDYKALRGDSSDNIPGIKGIGEKTATELIKKFGSLENIYQNYLNSDLSVRIKRLLEAGKESAFLSKELVTLNLNAPINFNLDSCSFADNYDRDKVFSLFREFEFTSLFKKLPLVKPKSKNFQLNFSLDSTKENTKKNNTDYWLVDTEEKFQSVLKDLKNQRELAFDVEATSLNPLKADLVGISFCWQEKKAVYLAFNSSSEITVLREKWLKELKPILENPKIEKYGHNLKFDCLILQKHGIFVNPISFDTMLASYVLNPGGHVGLKNLAFIELGVEMIEIEELLGKGKKQISFDLVPLADAANYSCADADITFRLVKFYQKKLKECPEQNTSF